MRTRGRRYIGVRVRARSARGGLPKPCAFLESAHADGDPLCAAYVLMLCWAGLRRLLELKQYTSAAFAGLASEFAVTLSHGRTGQCWDNALSESFFASLKAELIDLQAWPTRAMARRAVVEYIGWYNGTRLHSTLGYTSPAEYEEQNKIRNVA
jgi:hypothetical protein